MSDAFAPDVLFASISTNLFSTALWSISARLLGRRRTIPVSAETGVVPAVLVEALKTAADSLDATIACLDPLRTERLSHVTTVHGVIAG